MKNDLPLGEWGDPSSSALILVDVQNDFCHPEGGLGQRGVNMGPIQEMLPRLMRLMEGARGGGAHVISLWTSHWPERTWPAYHRMERFKFGSADPGSEYTPLVAEGTWGADICEGFEPQPGEILIKKNRYGGFTGTNLDLVLRSLGVKTLILTGVATNVCVESTAREGFMLDYNVVLVEDACGATSREEHEATLLTFRNYFGRVATVEEVVTAWAERGAAAKT